METPTTIRRNPPRKAKLTSTEKNTVKEYRSTRKRFVTESKVLMPSLTAADEDSKVKPTEVNASFRETLPEANSVAYSLHHRAENPTDARNCVSYASQLSGSAFATEIGGHAHDHAAPESNLHHLIGDEQVSLLRTSSENISNSGIMGFEAENPQREAPSRQTKKHLSDKVRVFLRIRPAQVVRAGKRHTGRVQRPLEIANRCSQQWMHPPASTMMTSDVPAVCVLAQTPDCITLSTPMSYLGAHKPKAEEFNGFSRIFSSDSTQKDVFEEVLAPRLADLLKGESSLVVAMGPTSAGKTHTMIGSPGDPGLVPRSLQYLFASNKLKAVPALMKIVISMFEIYSEQGGRPEKIFDLLRDGAELTLQQSKIKGLHEAVASTAEEAHEIYMSGLQRRTMASTAANHQSSRSHCIFNISTCQAKELQYADAFASSRTGTLTIADLAGFERERKTKNQGVRLTESSFINNTSMVFGQCLRALLEHQKNPKKTLQRHFQYSMLTRYLKPYMEANGNMTLIVNVSPCEEDYLDTAFVLRQVAPYSKIRFNSLSTKENLEGLKVEKRSLPSKEKQQPTTKRRKVDVAMHGSLDAREFVIVKKSKKAMSADPHIGVEGLPTEVCSSQGVAAGGTVNESMKVTGMSSETALAPHTPRDWKANLLTETRHILLQEGVKNFDQVSDALMKILDTAAGHCYSAQELLERSQEQRAEITLLDTKLLKEQQHASALSMEVERLTLKCANLENQLLRLKSSSISTDMNYSGHSISAQACILTEKITQTNSGSRVRALEDRVYDEDMNESFLSAFPDPLFTKNPSEMNSSKALLPAKLEDNHDGLKKVASQKFEDLNDGLSVAPPTKQIISPGLKEYETLDMGKNFHCSGEKVPGMISCIVSVPLCIDNEQEEERHGCDSIQDLEMDSTTLSLNTEDQNLQTENYLEGSGGHVTCHHTFKDDDCHEQKNVLSDSPKLPQISPLLPANSCLSQKATEKQSEFFHLVENHQSSLTTTAQGDPKLRLRDEAFQQSQDCLLLGQGSNSVKSFCIHHRGQEGRHNVCAIEAEYVNSKNHSQHPRQGQATCNQAIQESEYLEEQKAIKSLETAQIRLFSGPNLDLSRKEADGVGALDEHMDNCSDVSTEMVGGDRKTQTRSEEGQQSEMVGGDCKTQTRSEEGQQSEKSSILGPRSSVSPHIQEAYDITKGLNNDRNSNFQKGKLLALALMQESKNIREAERDHTCPHVHSPFSTGTLSRLGPIGHDVEDILETPLSEIEKDLWLPEAIKGAKISQLLAKYGGILDINNFSRRSSCLRQDCLRYCLAVISNKMNVEGKWVPLSKETLSSRKKHFYAVVQARTVVEATGHARAGFEVEALSNSNVTANEQMSKTHTEGKAPAYVENMVTKDYDDKENSSSPVSRRDKPRTATKRRRLQPLSSLSLHAGPNFSTDLASIDANVDEPKSLHERSAGNGASTLAYLLTRHNS